MLDDPGVEALPPPRRIPPAGTLTKDTPSPDGQIAPAQNLVAGKLQNARSNPQLLYPPRFDISPWRPSRTAACFSGISPCLGEGERIEAALTCLLRYLKVLRVADNALEVSSLDHTSDRFNDAGMARERITQEDLGGRWLNQRSFQHRAFHGSD